MTYKKLINHLINIGTDHNLELLIEQNKFILGELYRVNTILRRNSNLDLIDWSDDKQQTMSSFNFQWDSFNEGSDLPNDKKFMGNVTQLICSLTDLPSDWFINKRILDIGCGIGRFSYGLLSMGAFVTAVDQSLAALEQVRNLCQPFKDRLTTNQINLLDWDETADYDMVFCYGVVHHTGNTYLAIRNASLKVKPGGYLFLMVYGVPRTESEFEEVNRYYELRKEIIHLSFEDKREFLIKKFGPDKAHGWFDAISPTINDLLTFEELKDLLVRLNFSPIKRTLDERNHNLIAKKRI